MTTDTTTAGGWYITRENGQTDGPLSDAEMRQAIGRGRVKPNDHVWRDGMDEWVEAQRIPNYRDVRREYSEAAVTQGRDRGRDRARLERSSNDEEPSKDHSGSKDRQARKTSSQRSRSAQPIPRSSSSWSRDGRRTPASSSSAAQSKSTSSSGDEPKTPAGFPWKDVMGGKDKNTIDLEKMFGESAAKIGKIPQGTIIFFVLGFFFVPLLPVFWFIAWRIWAKANKK